MIEVEAVNNDGSIKYVYDISYDLNTALTKPFAKKLAKKLLVVVEQEKKFFQETRRDSYRQKGHLHYLEMVEQSLKVQINDNDAKNTTQTTFQVDEKLVNDMKFFGFTKNQAIVYNYMAQHQRPITAPEIWKILHLPRTEVYHILLKLVNYGLAYKEPHHLKTNALSFASNFFISEPNESMKQFTDIVIKQVQDGQERVLKTMEKYIKKP